MSKPDREDLLTKEFFHPDFELNFLEIKFAGNKTALTTCKGVMEVDRGKIEKAKNDHNRDWHSDGGPSCNPYQLF